jgi:hypothetical protein
MADTNFEGEGKPDPHVERGFDRRIIWVMIAAGVVFVAVFIFLAFGAFSPDKTPSTTGASGGSSQQTGGQSGNR